MAKLERQAGRGYRGTPLPKGKSDGPMSKGMARAMKRAEAGGKIGGPSKNKNVRKAERAAKKRAKAGLKQARNAKTPQGRAAGMKAAARGARLASGARGH